MISVQYPLDLESFVADAVCLIPMDVCVVNAAVLHSDGSPTFQFTPTAWAVLLAKTRQVPHTPAFGDNLDQWQGGSADSLVIETGLEHHPAAVTCA